MDAFSEGASWRMEERLKQSVIIEVPFKRLFHYVRNDVNQRHYGTERKEDRMRKVMIYLLNEVPGDVAVSEHFLMNV